MVASSRWRNLGAAAGAATAALFAIFDLYQWALAYAGDRFHNDFTFYFAAAKIGLTHGWGSIYDLALQQAPVGRVRARSARAQAPARISGPAGFARGARIPRFSRKRDRARRAGRGLGARAWCRRSELILRPPQLCGGRTCESRADDRLL